LIEEAFFDVDASPLRHPAYGYARARWSYDENNTRIDAHYFDVINNELRPRVTIKSVIAGSRAEGLDLKEGDILVSYEWQEVRNTYHFLSLRRAVAEQAPPKELTLIRDGKPVIVQLPGGRLGIELEDRLHSPLD
jgi:hypothetical protein